MKPNEDNEPSIADLGLESAEVEEEATLDIDDTAKEIYDEENHAFVAEVESTPSFIIELFAKRNYMRHVYSALERVQILAARAGIGTLEGGVRKPEKSEGAFSAYIVVSIPKGVLERAGVSWEDAEEAFNKSTAQLSEWADKSFDSPDPDEDEDELEGE